VGAGVGAPILARSAFDREATTIAEAPARAIDSAAKRIATATKQTYPGFDTNEYPGDNAMDAWRQSGEYHWVGYYLQGGCHKDGSWSGKRKRLIETGWGMAVVYVGQQTWGKSIPSPAAGPSAKSKNSKPGQPVRTMTRQSSAPVANTGDTCSVQFVNAERGVLDAADAIAKAESEGFEKGSTIFLDVERMENIPAAMRDYYQAWTQAVIADGRYRPGYYAHTHNAEEMYDDIREVFDAAGIKTDPPFWIAGTRGFDIEKRPTDVGHSFAAVWQGLLDVVRTHNGVKLPVDINVSAVPSPSAVSTE